MSNLLILKVYSFIIDCLFYLIFDRYILGARPGFEKLIKPGFCEAMDGVLALALKTNSD